MVPLTYGKHRPASRRGSIFIMSMVILFVLLLLGVSLIESAQNAVSRAALENGSTRTFHLAEGAVHKALHEINRGNGWLTYEGEMNMAMGGGTASIAVWPSASQRGMYTDHVILIANGRLRRPGSGAEHSCTLRVIAHKDPQYFAYAVFGDQSVKVGNGTVTMMADSYSSDDGAYGGANAGTNADIGTNSTAVGAVRVLPLGEIHGNVSVGSGAAAPESCVDNMGTITGTITALDTPSSLPDVTNIPSDATSLGDIWLEADQELVLNEGTYYITDLEIFGNAQITCNGRVVLYIDQSSDISTPDIRIGGNGIVNTSQIPSNLIIYCSPDVVDVAVTGNGVLYAGLYAPQADIVVNSGEIYGSVVGKTVDLKGSNSHIHYDEALRDHANPNAFLGSWEVL
jgi:hypothetical protein